MIGSVFPMYLENVEYPVIYKDDSAVNSRSGNGRDDMEELLFEAYPDIMTVLQVSEALHIGRNSAYNLINSNSIRHLRIGSSIRVPKSCLVEYVASAWYTARKPDKAGCSDCQKGDRDDWQPANQK